MKKSALMVAAVTDSKIAAHLAESASTSYSDALDSLKQEIELLRMQLAHSQSEVETLQRAKAEAQPEANAPQAPVSNDVPTDANPTLNTGERALVAACRGL